MVMNKQQIPLVRKIRHGLEYLFLSALFVLFGALSLDRASALGGFLGATFGPLFPITRRAFVNLTMAFPGWSDAEIRATVRRMWEHLGRIVAEYPRLRDFDCDGPDQRIEVLGIEYLDQLRDDGIAGIFISCHTGNWELHSRVAASRGLPLVNVYRAANNPYVEKLIQRFRDSLGATHYPKGVRAARALLEAIKRGDHLGILADQKYNEGIPIKFFGRDAMTTSVPAELAIRFNIPLVPARVERLRGAHFRLTIFPPLTLPDSGDRESDVKVLTGKVSSLFEAWIRERPEQWLWLHRRWPSKF